MTAEKLLRIWLDAANEDAQKRGNFYEILESKTGMTRAQVSERFATWNALSHEHAVAIADRHGVTVVKGGFQAYLIELGLGEPQEG